MADLEEKDQGYSSVVEHVPRMCVAVLQHCKDRGGLEGGGVG